MKKLFLLMWAMALIFAVVPFAAAQAIFGEYATRDGLRLLEIGKALAAMPESGGRAEDYVPPHWTITDRVEGDMNADGVKDFAFTMMLDETDKKYMASLEKLFRDASWIDKTFIIVVVDSRGDRKMHLSAINYNLYGDSDAPARNGDARDEFKLSLKKDVLVVNLNYGGMMRTSASFLFRDSVLVGFDVENYCVTITENCGKSRTSENYLTNTSIETDYKLIGDKLTGRDTKTKIPPVKVDFMNARLNYGGGKGVRPF